MGLLVNENVEGQVFLVCGWGPMCEKRVQLLLKYGAEARLIQDRFFTVDELESLGRDAVDNVVEGVFIVPELDCDHEKLEELANLCKRRRIPVNVTEHPDLCTFTLLSTYEDGPFQLGITTNGMGCRLANRVKRTAVNALPPEIGAICENVGALRRAHAPTSSEDDDDDAEQSIRLNQLITSTREDRAQKLRWLSQMVEYYPLASLRSITAEDLALEMRAPAKSESQENLKKGSISLVGAGPGSVGLLTTEALQDINSADYVLADKLVPEEVLALIPRSTPLFIARKFPGNAERAQEELLDIGLEQLKQGKKVVRLKQGDPYVYGRGMEEFLFFRERGYVPKVVAGITSALAAPLLAQIPPTHRGFADQVLICTGTGRAGTLPEAPDWVESRTTIFLMSLHRIKDIVAVLLERGWPAGVPVAAIERASCPDQRIVRSSIQHIAKALEAVGSRPPGLLVAGKVCDVAVQLAQGEKWIVEG